VLRRGLAVLTLLALAFGLGTAPASAHAGLVASDPRAGATLGASPTVIRLTFSEPPEPSLSTIQVVDAAGIEHVAGTPDLVPTDPLSLAVQVQPLAKGVYTVAWRSVSAIDGHATAGAYTFGVLVPPTAVLAAPSTTTVSSPLEVVARWVFILGLVALLGAAVAALARFGAAKGEDLQGAVGWALAVVGLVLLVEAQRRNAGASFGELFDTQVGLALAWRAAAIVVAGVGLLGARGAGAAGRRAAMGVAAAATLAAMALHVATGHAAVGGSVSAPVAFQWTHFAAVGIWIGGLAALVVGVRGKPSAAKAQAVRRFSTLAGVALVVVAVTGTIRAVGELSSWRELVSTGYGRGVLAKGALILVIAAFGARNRYRSVPAAASDLGGLRRTSRGELVFAASAMVVAALLGTLSPPVARELVAPLGLTASGSDSGTTVRVELTTASADPGPNRFVVRAVDFDTGEPVRADRVSLRFTPIDDASVASTSLDLAGRKDGSFVGSGANLAFDGRWRVTVFVERGADSVEIPLVLEAHTPAQSVSIQNGPGRVDKYTVTVTDAQFVRFTVPTERTDRTEVLVTCVGILGEQLPIEQLVVTAAAGDEPARRVPVRRLSRGRFVAIVDLRDEENTLAAVAQTAFDTRFRAVVDLGPPEGG
jgi:copper transport protein